MKRLITLLVVAFFIFGCSDVSPKEKWVKFLNGEEDGAGDRWYDKGSTIKVDKDVVRVTTKHALNIEDKGKIVRSRALRKESTDIKDRISVVEFNCRTKDHRVIHLHYTDSQDERVDGDNIDMPNIAFRYTLQDSVGYKLLNIVCK